MDRCTQYAKLVTSGLIVAGELMILSCKRHLDDLKRQNTKDFPYYYDEKMANRVIEFAETLYIAEGKKTKLHLADWQCFIFGNLYGWYNSKGFRRFRLSYAEVARQQGKSLINGINGTYIGNFTGYNYGQLYFAATKQDQAKIVFNEVVKFIEADEELGELFEVKDYKSEIKCKITNSTMKALSKDTKKIDGFRPIFASIDEYHAHEDNQMYKLLEGGTGRLDETLISIITTAGFNLNSPCYEMRRYAENVLRKTAKNETMFVAIFSLDKDDDIWDEKNWIKANPLVCSTQKGVDNMKDIAVKAKEMGGFELRDFLTKRLNIWVQQSDNQYMSPEVWKKCGTETTLEDMKGQRCFVGIDLSSGGDLTSIALEFPLDENRYYIYSHSFMPRQRLNEHIKTDIAPYDIWEKQGLITVTDTLSGVKNDYKFILKHLQDLVEKYDLEIVGIGYDPHGASGFLADLESFGVPLVSINQSARFLNDATMDFELTAKAKNIVYDKANDLMTWSVVNAKKIYNSFGEVKVDKEKNARSKRIDVVDAIIDAHCLAMKKSEKQIDLNSHADNYMKIMGWS